MLPHMMGVTHRGGKGLLMMQHSNIFHSKSLSSGKKKANSATTNFAQLHLDELPTSKRGNKQETFKKINERFHLNGLKRNISICSDWASYTFHFMVKITQTFKII